MKKVFISFDYDYDRELKDFLVGQARNPVSPFEISDWSVKAHLIGDWKAQVRAKMMRVDIVVFICGHHTNIATGVNTELEIAQSLGKKYFLLAGRKAGGNKRPKSAKASDKVYNWTWENLKLLIAGNR